MGDASDAAAGSVALHRRGRARRPRRYGTGAGFTLGEVLVVLACLAILSAVTVPGVNAALETSRTHAAARYLHLRLALARALAVSRGVTIAVRFEGPQDRTVIGMYADGNGNGVRVREIESGVDPGVTPPVVFTDLFAGRVLVLAGDAADLLSFTPVGTASSGTVEILGPGGTRFGVRVLGTTGRARVVRYDAALRDWVDAW